MSSDGASIPDIQDLTLERSVYIGNAISLILYGINLYMYCQSVNCLLYTQTGDFRRRLFYVAYGGVMLLLITFAVSANAVFGQLMFVEHRDYPGGPVAYFGENISLWINTLGSAADITVNFMGDGLLVYRCYIIWGSKWYIVAIPILIFIASTVLAILTVVESALPNASIFTGASQGFGVPWISLTVALNVIVTIMICTRLLMARHQVRAALTRQMSDMYTGLVAILVESALPFSVLGLCFVVTFAKNLDVEVAFAFIWGTLCAVSPQLIILRVAMGRGWSRKTATRFVSSNTMIFTSNAPQSIGLTTMDSYKNTASKTDTDTTYYVSNVSNTNSVSKSQNSLNHVV